VLQSDLRRRSLDGDDSRIGYPTDIIRAQVAGAALPDPREDTINQPLSTAIRHQQCVCPHKLNPNAGTLPVRGLVQAKIRALVRYGEKSGLGS
jgi:hypothetical protein